MKGFFKPQKAVKSPYLDDARGAFNEMYGAYVHAARQWRLVASIEGVALVILIAGFVSLSLQHKVVPYAVEFNEHAEAVRVTRADEMAQPNEGQIRAGLRNWLVGARTVYVDRRAQDNLFKATYAMTLPNSAAYKTLYDYHTANNPYEVSEKNTVEVVVNNVRSISDKTWLIEWTETRRERSGAVLDSVILNGSFTVAIVPPVEEGQIMVNPIGLFVEQFSWGKRQ
ncbi:MAG TPA: type IV secretion system protein [Nitrosospira sp.]|nr:type IV secretion system protein [Nitrosospira sp.]